MADRQNGDSSDPPSTEDWRSSFDASDPLLEQFIGDLEAADDPAAVRRDYSARYADRGEDFERTFRFWMRLKAQLKSPTPISRLPRKFGDFEILREIARGGMGIVYEAQQLSLQRRVAIKTLQKPSAAERFRNEQKCLAQFFLANVVPLYEAGEHLETSQDANEDEERRTPYLVMPFVDGATLDKVVKTASQLRDQPGRGSASSIGDIAKLSNVKYGKTDGPDDAQQTPSHRASLKLGEVYFRSVVHCVIEIAKAIQESHDLGIVHRDLKPENVMVNKEGHTFIIDFGLASPLDATLKEAKREPESPSTLRLASGVMGTPEYAAPEQFDGRFNLRTDVWGLGCILYELLAFRRAYKSSTRSGQPQSPREINAAAPRDLDAIALRCLQLDPSHRYPSALALAQDLDRWLHHKPVQARSPGPLERTAKWVRRHRVASVLIGVGVIGACLAMSGLLYHSHRLAGLNEQLSTSLNETRQRERRIRRHDYALHLSNAYRSWKHAKIAHVVDLLRRDYRPDDDVDLRGWEWFLLNGACQSDTATLRGHQAGVTCLAYTPDALRIVSGDTAGQLRVWNRESGESERAIAAHDGNVTAIAVNNDGDRAVTAGADSSVQLWKLPELSEPQRLEGHILPVGSVVFHPHEPKFATASEDGSVKVWNGADLSELATFQHPEGVVDVSYSRDGTLLLVALRRKIIVWDIGRHERQAEIPSPSTLRCVRVTPDNRFILGAAADSSILVWDASTYELTKKIGDESLRITQLEMTTDGRRLIAANGHATLHVYDLETDRLLRTIKGHRGEVQCLAICPDETQVASGSLDQTVKLWSLEASPAMRTLSGHPLRVTGLAFSSDGARLVSSSYDQSASVWNLTSSLRESGFGETEVLRDPVTGLPASLSSSGGHGSLVMDVAFDASGQRVASAGFDKSVRIWIAGSGEELRRLVHGGEVVAVAFSPDGKQVASAAWDDFVYIWDAETGQGVCKMAGHTKHPTDIVYSPDGQKLASAGQDGLVKTWNASGKELATLRGHRGAVRSLAWSRDGQWIASGGKDQTIVVWDAETGTQRFTLQGHTGSVTGLSFHPIELRLASASSDASDNTVRIWDLQSGEQVAVFDGAAPIAFSPRGDKLAFRGTANTIQVWNAAHGAGLPAPIDEPVRFAEVTAKEDFQIPQDGGLKTLGYFTTTSLPSLRDPQQTFDTGEDEQYFVVVMSVPAKLLRPPPAVYQKLVESEASQGKKTAVAERLTLYLPSLFSLERDANEPIEAQYLSEWPDNLGFVDYMVRTRSETIPEAMRIAISVAWKRKPDEPAAASVRFRGRDAVPVTMNRLQFRWNRLLAE